MFHSAEPNEIADKIVRSYKQIFWSDYKLDFLLIKVEEVYQLKYIDFVVYPQCEIFNPAFKFTYDIRKGLIVFVDSVDRFIFANPRAFNALAKFVTCIDHIMNV